MPGTAFQIAGLTVTDILIVVLMVVVFVLAVVLPYPRRRR
jgi:hypothetical protein